ncbi:hypothetical protein QMK61_06920 [Fulvimonas sp. R45]|uniref:XAC0095 family protein n=1 Tax=Fulvimonas sp. R45 TaxID=3045937 RepID=UPI0026603F59|nr:hypothetical protein [Fulvimonas sp. R45]MDO1528567.1 hypothetical protein [Fulvimonas sp. R45]
MSMIESEDPDAMGYFLPEESQFRLKRVREYVEFLSHLAQPRTPDASLEGLPEINMGEVAICLELLAEQLGMVLDDMSWPAQRQEEAASTADGEPGNAGPVPGGAGGRYVFGVTLDQVDRLDQLIGMITAHGDVVTASDDAELTSQTLPMLGHAIFNDARAMFAIVREVTSQRLGPARGPHARVGEERATYLPHDAPPACLPDTASSRGRRLHAGGTVMPFPVPGPAVGKGLPPWAAARAGQVPRPRAIPAGP